MSASIVGLNCSSTKSYTYHAVKIHVMISKPFSELAKVYDLIFDEIEYDDWTQFTLETLRHLACTLKPGSHVLDLACGTGSSSLPYLQLQ